MFNYIVPFGSLSYLATNMTSIIYEKVAEKLVNVSARILTHRPWANETLRATLWAGMQSDLEPNYLCHPLLPTFMARDLRNYIIAMTALSISIFIFGRAPTAQIEAQKLQARRLRFADRSQTFTAFEFDKDRRFSTRVNELKPILPFRQQEHKRSSSWWVLQRQRLTPKTVALFLMLWAGVIGAGVYPYWHETRGVCVCMPCIVASGRVLVWPLFNY